MKLILSSMLFLLLSTPAYALGTCDSILQYGIFDERQNLNIENQYKLIKNSLCKVNKNSSSGGGQLDVIGIFKAGGKGSTQEYNKYCKSSYDEIRSDSDLKQFTKKVSSVIVNAWRDCKKSTKLVTHYVTPTIDPSKFVYGMHFRGGPDAPRKVKIIRWKVSGAKCDTNFKGQLIGNDIIETQCTRRPNDLVSFTATSQGYGGNLKSIHLPPDSSCGSFFKGKKHFTEFYDTPVRNYPLVLKVSGNYMQGNFSGWFHKKYNNGGWSVEGSYNGNNYSYVHRTKKGSLVTGTGECDSVGASGMKEYKVNKQSRGPTLFTYNPVVIR